jgi:hypothetical protein
MLKRTSANVLKGRYAALKQASHLVILVLFLRKKKYNK